MTKNEQPPITPIQAQAETGVEQPVQSPNQESQVKPVRQGTTRAIYQTMAQSNAAESNDAVEQSMKIGLILSGKKGLRIDASHGSGLIVPGRQDVDRHGLKGGDLVIVGRVIHEIPEKNFQVVVVRPLTERAMQSSTIEQLQLMEGVERNASDTAEEITDDEITVQRSYVIKSSNNFHNTKMQGPLETFRLPLADMNRCVVRKNEDKNTMYVELHAGAWGSNEGRFWYVTIPADLLSTAKPILQRVHDRLEHVENEENAARQRKEAQLEMGPKGAKTTFGTRSIIWKEKGNGFIYARNQREFDTMELEDDIPGLNVVFGWDEISDSDDFGISHETQHFRRERPLAKTKRTKEQIEDGHRLDAAWDEFVRRQPAKQFMANVENGLPPLREPVVYDTETGAQAFPVYVATAGGYPGNRFFNLRWFRSSEAAQKALAESAGCLDEVRSHIEESRKKAKARKACEQLRARLNDYKQLGLTHEETLPFHHRLLPIEESIKYNTRTPEAALEEIQKMEADCNECIAAKKIRVRELQEREARGEILVSLTAPHRRRGTTRNADAWVIRPDGSLREPDEKRTKNDDGDYVWHIVEPSEVALTWYCTSTVDVDRNSTCVVEKPSVDALTPEQEQAIRKIEMEIHVRPGSFDIDTKKPAHHTRTSQESASVESVPPTENAQEPPVTATTDQIQSLLSKFGGTNAKKGKKR